MRDEMYRAMLMGRIFVGILLAVIAACIVALTVFSCSPAHEPFSAPPPEPGVDTVSVVCRVGPGWSVVFDRESGRCIEPTRNPEHYDLETFAAPEKAEQDSTGADGMEVVVIIPDGVVSQQEIKPCPR